MSDEELKEEENPQSAVPHENTEWFVLRVISGKERKISEFIQKEINIQGWTSSILQVLCPVEKVFKVQRGKKVLKEKILYPGYLMLEAQKGELNSVMVSTIQNLTNVIYFLGREQPIAMRKSEVNRMFGKMDEVSEQGIGMIESFIVGETVRITDGPFNDFTGDIEEINNDKKRLKVVVKIFGRATPVELAFTQVEKAL